MKAQILVWVAAALVVTLVMAAWIKQRTVAPKGALEVIVDPDDWHDGAAALAMTLALYGKRTTVTELVPLVQDEQGYCNALRMTRTARARGLEVRGMQLEQSAALKHIRRGDILHLKRNAFVVFDEIRGQEAVIVDPTSGRVALSVDALWREMSGVVLMFGLEGSL